MQAEIPTAHEHELKINLPEIDREGRHIVELTDDEFVIYDLSNKEIVHAYSFHDLPVYLKQRISEDQDDTSFKLILNGHEAEFVGDLDPKTKALIDSLKKKCIVKEKITEHYDVQENVGRGGYAHVYRAVRKSDGKDVVIKEFIKDHPKKSQAEMYKMFLEEIKTMRKLGETEGISQLFEAYDCGEKFSIVTNLLEGSTLKEKVRMNEKLDEEVAKRVIRRVVEILNDLHTRGFVHNDLKPDNLMFSDGANEESVHIIDFGTASRHDKEEPSVAIEAEKKTAEPVIKKKKIAGTMGYVDPAVLAGQDPCPLSDMFGIGVITHYVLFGENLFRPFNPNGMMSLNKRCKINFDKPKWGNISEEGVDFVRRLCTKTKEGRLTAQEALEHPWLRVQPKPQYERPKIPANKARITRVPLMTSSQRYVKIFRRAPLF